MVNIFINIAGHDYDMIFNYISGQTIVWRSRPFIKRCAGERVWNHAVHRVVTLEFIIAKKLSISNDYFSLTPHGKVIGVKHTNTN